MNKTGSEAKRNTRWKLAIAAAVVLFELLAGWNIKLPGLYYDEVIQISPALNFVKGRMRSQTFAGVGSEFEFHGRTLPSVSLGYLGGLKTIAFVPIAATAELSPRTIRSFTIQIGALALIAISAFAWRFLGPAAAAIGVLLVGTDPSYIMFCRTDYGPTVFMMLFKGVALWQLVIWRQTGRPWPLYRAALAMGLGVYDKTNFLWILFAIAGAGLFVAPRLVIRFKPREAMLAGSFLMLGCLPLIAYNLQWPPPTWTALKAQDILGRRNETETPHSFKELERRLKQRTNVFQGLLTATTVHYVRDLPKPRAVVMPFVALAASVITLLCYAAPGLRSRWRREMWLLLVTSLIILSAAVTPGAYKDHHLILAYPFLHLLAATVLVRGAGLCLRMRKPVGVIAAGGLFLAGTAAPAAVSILRYQQVMTQLQKTGGENSWSDGIYELDAWLERHDPLQPIVAVDWGIEQPLAVLSQGHLPCVERWVARDTAAYREFLNIPGSRYVLHAPDATEFPEAREVFLEAVRLRGLEVNLVKTITDRTGRPVLLVYVVPRTNGGQP